MEAFRALLDLMLPRRCIVCGERLNIRERHCCLGCLVDLPHTFYWTWEDNPMALRFRDASDSRSEPGMTIPPTCSEAWKPHAAALFFYRNGSGYERITQELKYGYNRAAGRYFAGMLAARLAEGGQFADVDLVVPVPLHWTRRYRRGYNQAEVIAAVVARALGAPFAARALVRVRRTRTQTAVAVDAKASNVAGAFRPGRRLPRSPRHILLVDDVFTTGATLGECARTLRAAFGDDVRISAVTLACIAK